MKGHGWPLGGEPRTVNRLTVDDIGHYLAHMNRHLHTVTAEAHGIKHALMLANFGQAISAHIHRTAPAIINFTAGQLWKHGIQRLAQDLTTF